MDGGGEIFFFYGGRDGCRRGEAGRSDIATVSFASPVNDCFWALFSSEKISDFGTVALSFVCDKYYPIMD